MKFFSLIVACAAVSYKSDLDLIPGDVQAEKMRQANGSANVDTRTDLSVVCHDIQCADIECLPPFELRRAKGQCCPTCFAEDHVVAIDRHQAMEGENPHATPRAPAAPSTCTGVKCFKAVCFEGKKVGHEPGRCCLTCV